jgi:hypothetical protein
MNIASAGYLGSTDKKSFQRLKLMGSMAIGGILKFTHGTFLSIKLLQKEAIPADSTLTEG